MSRWFVLWYHGITMEPTIDLGDLLAIAEHVLGTDAHALKNMTRIAEAESALAAPHASFSGKEFYPDAPTKAAILCSRLIRNHPLPDGNKRVAFLLMLEFLTRSKLRFVEPDQDHIADVIEQVAGREIEEADFVAWVAARVEPVT